ncbi:MAG: CU044_2847 family protein [Cyanobacteria bacterium J06632_3]
MAQLVPILLEDGTEIFIESTGETPVPSAPDEELYDDDEETVRGGQKGWLGGGSSRGFNDMPSGASVNSNGNTAAVAAAQSFKAIEGTIRTYTKHTLSAFKNTRASIDGNINKVTLQFGIRLSGEAGIPYVTKGTAESNLSITVECSFDKEGNPSVVG